MRQWQELQATARLTRYQDHIAKVIPQMLERAKAEEIQRQKQQGLGNPIISLEMQPHLALHYTSGGSDGPMGPGWSLTGLSAIVRCGKTWASSGGAPVGVTLSTGDDLCLDGNRLRLTSGTQGVAGR